MLVSYTLWCLCTIVLCVINNTTVQPRLSGLAGDKKVHYHACAEGVASDLLWVWSQVER